MALVTIQTLSQLLFKAAQSPGNRYSFNPAGHMVLAELLKLSISLLMVLRTERFGLLRPRAGRIGTLTTAAMRLGNIYRMPLFQKLAYFALAAGYALNNQLTFAILRSANPGLLSLAKTSTPLLIAACSALFFGEQFSRLQWQCVVLQVCGMVSIVNRRSLLKSANSDKSQYQFDTKPSPTDVSSEPMPNIGILIILACLLTAACSAANSYLLKGKVRATKESGTASQPQSGPIDCWANIHVQNTVLYSFGTCANLVLFAAGLTSSATVGLLSGYESPMAILLLFSNALVGLLVTFVYKRGNAVVKTLASSVSSALLLLLPTIEALVSGVASTDEDTDTSSLQTITGCIVILTSAIIFMENS